MNSEEGNLFANVLKQKRNVRIKAAPAEEEKQLPASSSASKPTNMFAKLRTNSSAAKIGGQNEEQKAKDSGAALDSLFAAAPVERKSQMGKMKRGLSEDFLSQVNQNNLVLKVKDVKKQTDNNDDAHSGRNSVSSNIALFQNQINTLNSGRGANPLSSARKIAAEASDVGSNGRNSVKDLIMQFNGGLGQKEDEKLKMSPDVVKRRNKKQLIGADEERKSLGDAFMQQVNNQSPEKDAGKRAGSQGFRLQGHANSVSGRLSLGDQFMENAQKNKETDERDSQLSAPKNNRSTNIFNKVRAMQASSKFSVRSETDQQESSNFKSNNIFSKQTRMVMPTQDDGGIGANLVSMDQMAKNLVRGTTDTGDLNKTKNYEDKNSDALHKLEHISQKAGLSPDAVHERASIHRPFDLSNQLKELKANALEHRSNSRTTSPKGSIRSNSQSTKKMPLKAPKPLGKVKDRDSTGGLKSDRSQLTADIIVYKSMTPEEDKKRAESLEQKKTTEFAPARAAGAVGAVAVGGEGGGEIEGVQLAAKAEQPRGRPKTRAERDHEQIGAMVFNQEMQHQNSEREYKLDHAKPGAKKLKPGAVLTNTAASKPQEELKSSAAPYDEIVTKEENTVTKLNASKSQPDIAEANLNMTDDNTHIVSANHSNLFADGPIKDKQEQRSRLDIGEASTGRIGRDMKNIKERENNSNRNQSESMNNRNKSFGTLLSPKTSSKARNDDFIEYVVGGDSLLPKRVRSKKSDLPYSKGSLSPVGSGRNMLDGLKAQIAREDDEGRPIKSRGGQSQDEVRAVFSSSEDDFEPGADLKRLEDEQTLKLQEEVDQAAAALLLQQEDDEECNAEESTPDEEDEDEDDLDEVERRIAEQERMINDEINANSQARASFNNAEVPLDSKQGLAEFLQSSKDSSSIIASKDQALGIHHVQDELELEEFQNAEQRRLEDAIQQVQGNNRSNSQLDFEVSNIQKLKNDSLTRGDISEMQAKIDAMGGSPNRSALHNRRPDTVIKANAGSRLSGMHDVSDITDNHALRNNYLEKSQMDAGTDVSTSILMEKNKREQQLRYELEILELELELQMNEAEFSDEDEEGRGSHDNRIAHMQKSANQVTKSGRQHLSDYNDNLNRSPYGGTMEGHLDSFMRGNNGNNLDDTHLRRPPDSHDNRLASKMQSALTFNNDMSQSQWALRQQRHDQIVMPINLEDQEVLCSNCFETIPMSQVDKHSMTCSKDEPSFRASQNHAIRPSNITVDEEQEYRAKTEELNERIFKLIQTFLRKLDSQVFLDQIYTTHANEEVDDEERGGKVPTPSPEDHKQKPKSGYAMNSGKFQPNKSATALAEERSLIHEVVQHAHLALQGELHDVQSSAEQLDQLEEEHDLNQKFEFNNHMVYNRVVQVINIKLEVMQDFEKKANPDIVVPMTTKQIQQKQFGEGSMNYGFGELSLANVKKLPLDAADQRNSESQTTGTQHHRANSAERQLNEYIQASRAQALQQRKKKNIFQSKKQNVNNAETSSAGGNIGGENWILSDMGSDTYSAGGDSHSSYNSLVSKARFQSASVLQSKKLKK